jgi:hypothetical protein
MIDINPPTESRPQAPRRLQHAAEAILLLLTASVLTILFWWPLAVRGGFIGGDTYNYFFPLRDFYQQGLIHHELRLWHPGIGNGVPILGESQTGVFYPVYLLAYRFLDLNAAYSFVFLFHYLLAYVGSYALARTIRIHPIAAHGVSLIFVFGWFPPRACLEWAIVTGAWLPIILTLAVRFLIHGKRLDACGLAVAVALQLLAGHFNLAWITLLAVTFFLLIPSSLLPTSGSIISWTRRAATLLVILAGYLLAAPQLLPAWELKTRSQREAVDFREQIAQGNVPIHYFVRSQWPLAYFNDRDQVLAQLHSPTNKVEAHLYFGPIVLLLAAGSLLRTSSRRQAIPWISLALVMFLLATGILMVPLAELPGFRFFRYCGRYGIATQLGIAVAAGLTLDQFSRRSSSIGSLLSLSLFGILALELAFVGHQVQYVTIVDPPMISRRNQSTIFPMLQPTDRVLAIDGNTLALSGAACVPPYLGMGPAEYYKTWESFPNVFTGQKSFDDSIARVMARMGVSHLLTLAPLDPSWPTTLLYQGYDPFLHPRWGREPNEPLFLYRYQPHPGRAYRTGAGNLPMSDRSTSITRWEPHRVRIETDGPASASLILSDIMFPGWSVTVDGKPKPVEDSPMGRAVRVDPGKHQVEWSYQPRSLWLGLAISLATLFFGTLLTGLSRRRTVI